MLERLEQMVLRVIFVQLEIITQRQVDHFSGESGNVSEFTGCLGSVWDLWEIISWENFVVNFVLGATPLFISEVVA